MPALLPDHQWCLCFSAPLLHREAATSKFIMAIANDESVILATPPPTHPKAHENFLLGLSFYLGQRGGLRFSYVSQHDASWLFSFGVTSCGHKISTAWGLLGLQPWPPPQLEEDLLKKGRCNVTSVDVIPYLIGDIYLERKIKIWFGRKVEILFLGIYSSLWHHVPHKAYKTVENKL